MTDQNLPALIAALRETQPIPLFPGSDQLGNAVFIGCGDSLASAYVASRRGHRAVSAGDIEWMEELPARADSIIGISLSGTSGATIRSIRRGNGSGLNTIAVTSSPDTPLGESATHVQAIPRLEVDETVPIAGHLMLALGVASACGLDVSQVPAKLADVLESVGQRLIDDAIAQLPATMPSGITVLSLPDTRSGGNFWTLKFMEACGIPSRDVPLEESGHVDYFIGPEPNLVVGLVGRSGAARFDRLFQALHANGMPILSLDLGAAVPGDSDDDDLLRELVTAVIGAFVAKAAGEKWDRPAFRGGAVNMDASHIKIEF